MAKNMGYSGDDDDDQDFGKLSKNQKRMYWGAAIIIVVFVAIIAVANHGNKIGRERPGNQIPVANQPAGKDIVGKQEQKQTPKLVAELSGFGSGETSVFKVSDNWEARWTSKTEPTVITCTRFDANGDVDESFAIFGVDFNNRRNDSSFQKHGGRYSIEFNNLGGPWTIQIYQW